jgi:NAD(P)-dependent dehydrogenase (short-subunit alcohol dehydrogenase family)
MRIDLTGKVALVTGASSGIGHATALTLAECGAAVSINYHRNENGAEQARKQIVDPGGRAITVQANVTMSDDVDKLVARTTAQLGPLDILVNNAGSLIERLRILDLMIDTPYHEQFSSPEMMRGFVSATPLGRVGTAAEVANVIAFVASDAASYLVGETIEINGGMYMD